MHSGPNLRDTLYCGVDIIGSVEVLAHCQCVRETHTLAVCRYWNIDDAYAKGYVGSVMCDIINDVKRDTGSVYASEHFPRTT